MLVSRESVLSAAGVGRRQERVQDPATPRRVLVVTLAVALFLLAGTSVAIEVEPLDLRLLGAPAFESFTSRDGLPDGVITTIGVDAEGFAWATSQEGLHRFVGHRWQGVEGDGFGRVHRRMTLDPRGTLWLPTLDAGLLRNDAGVWTRVEQDTPPGPLYKLWEQYPVDSGDGDEGDGDAGGGTVRQWLLTWESGLFFRDGRSGPWTQDADNRTLPAGPLLSIAASEELFGEPRLWIGTGDHGLFFRPLGGTEWRRHDVPGLPTGQIEDVQVGRGERGEELWVSVFGAGLWRWDGERLRGWTRARGELPSDELYAITLVEVSDDSDSVSTAWVASRGGLVRVRGDRAESFDRRHGLPSDQIRNSWLWRGPDGQEVLWVATEGGVARAVLTGEQWRTVTLMGSGALGVFGLHVEPDGFGGERLWVASTRDGLGLWQDGEWRTFGQESGDLPSPSLRMVERIADHDGRAALFAGPLGGELVRIEDGPVFRVVPTPWPKTSVQVVMDVLSRPIDPASEPDGERELWFATQYSGIHRWRKDGWTAFPVGEEGANERTVELLEQVDGEGVSWLWAATTVGLWRFDGSRWTALHGIDGLPERTLLGLNLRAASGGRQVLWIGSSFDGLVRLDVTDPRTPFVLPSDGLPRAIDSTVYSAEHDSKGRVYLCTNVGVQQLTPVSGGGWTERVFDRRDGMVHEECNTNGQLVDEHDRFWTGTLGGLTVFDPAETTRQTSKRLHLIEVRADGVEVDPGAVVLRPGQRELRIESMLQTHQREGETLYRSQLLGVEERAVQWSSEPVRTLAGLPPGSHVLRIEARDFAGVDAEPLELPFRVVPAWWQRRWVQAALVLGALVLLLLAFDFQLRRLRRQKLRLEQMVSERTRELHDANRALRELSYTDSLTGLANRRRLLERLHALAAETPVGGGSGSCALVFIDVDLFKAYNDRLGHPAGDEALRVVARGLVSHAPESALVARYGGEEFACLLPDHELEAAVELAERMRATVDASTVEVPGSDQTERVTISAGVASVALRGESDVHRLLREADQALYRAKRAGRNRVET
ncbi:MAG: diguanylate cyclase [Acidobacteria bacterium]|nr:MAG: diguanylate cyclase [Acidobacteriota bacterium]